MSEMRNQGVWILCGVICIWPLAFHFLLNFIVKRVRTHGWRSLLPPYGHWGGGNVAL